MLTTTQRSEVNLNTDELHTDVTILRDSDLKPWDNSDHFVSAHTRDLVRTVLDCYVQQFFFYLGIPGNILCVIVFFKQGLSDRINLLLFSLAVADLINLVAQYVTQLDCYIRTWDDVEATNWVIKQNVKTIYVSLWASFVSGGLIVIMSVDRCLSVVMPLKAGRLLTYRAMLVAIVSMYVVLLIFHLPILSVFTIDWKTDPSTNRSMAFIAKKHGIIFNSKQAEELRSAVGTIFKPIFTITVTVCCIITIAKLRQASRKRLQMQEIQKQEAGRGDNRITKMLLFLCIVYVILFLPEVSTQMAYQLKPQFYLYVKYHNTFYVMYGVIYTASALNSTANFFAYVVLSSKFQTTLRELCQCCGRKPPSLVRQQTCKKQTPAQELMPRTVASQ